MQDSSIILSSGMVLCVCIGDSSIDLMFDVLFRCLLSKKAKPVMNIVQEVLSCVLRFSSQSALVSSTTSANNTYKAMCDIHRKFSNAARLLIKGKYPWIVM